MSDHSLNRYALLIEPMIGGQREINTGDFRPVYRPLMIYGQLLEMEKTGARDAGICSDVESLDSSSWSMLVRRVAGELFERKNWIEQSQLHFTHLVASQRVSGEFVPADGQMNLESRWYEELTLLHALASYAARSPDAGMDSAVRRAAQFHLHETQPDHASSDPWALLAFVRYAPPLADQVLHALHLQYPAGPTGVPLLLLVDVLYGLHRITTDLK